MRQRLAVRLYLAEAELRAAQRHHDGSPMACARYRAALQEWKAAFARIGPCGGMNSRLERRTPTRGSGGCELRRVTPFYGAG